MDRPEKLIQAQQDYASKYELTDGEGIAVGLWFIYDSLKVIDFEYGPKETKRRVEKIKAQIDDLFISINGGPDDE